MMGRQFDRSQHQGRVNNAHDYENNESDSRNRRANQPSGRWQPKPRKKETNIDDALSDAGSVASKKTEETLEDDATLQKRPPQVACTFFITF